MILLHVFFLIFLKNVVSSYYLITQQGDKLQCVTNTSRYLYFYGNTTADTFDIHTRFQAQISEFASKEKISVINLTEYDSEWKLINSTDGPVVEDIVDKRWETLPTIHLGYTNSNKYQTSSNQSILGEFFYGSNPKWLFCLSSYNLTRQFMQFSNPTWILYKLKNNTLGPLRAKHPKQTAICKLPEYTYFFASKPNEDEKCFNTSAKCISMFVAVCECCVLQVNFKYKYENTKRHITHNSKWQAINKNLKEDLTTICFKRLTKNDCTKTYFAIDDLRTCKQNVSRILQQPNPKLTKCAIDGSVNISLEIKNQKIDDSVNCSNNGLGPECIPCSYLSLNNNCSAMKICDLKSCSCSPGYMGNSCSEKCPSGSYGYYCKKKCDYCLLLLCDHVDGKCSLENYYYFGLLLLLIPAFLLVFVCKKYFTKKRLKRQQLLLNEQIQDSYDLYPTENSTVAFRKNKENAILLKDFNKFVQNKTVADFEQLFLDMNLKNIYKPQNESEIVLENNATAYIELTCARYINNPSMNKAYIIVQPQIKYRPTTFWKLMWQEKVKYVVWLNDIENPEENTKIKEAKYWPNSHDPLILDNNMSITKVSMNSFIEYDCIKYKIQKKNLERKVIQFFVKSWFTHIPMCCKFLNKLLITLLKKPLEAKSPLQSPLLVFVQPNDIEKANVIILADICLRMAAQEGCIDIKNNILQFRNFIPSAIKSPQDFELLYCLVADVVVNLNREIILKKELMQSNPKNILKNNFVQLQIQCIQNWFKSEKKMVFPQLKRSSLQNFLQQQEESLVDKSLKTLNGYFAHGFKKIKKFIVIPKPEIGDLSNLWKLISNCDVSLVVYLHKPTSKNNKFFPTAKNSWICTFDGILVKYVSSDEMCDFITNQYIVKNNNLQKTISVEVIYLKMWLPHELVPSNKKAFIDVLTKICKKSMTTKHTLLSCPDGITASGLFVIACHLIQKLREDNSVDVFKAISCLSQENRVIAYIKDQLEFLYEIAIIHSYNNNLQ